MAGNTIGQLFRVTTFGESHGLALGCIVDGVPPGISLTEADLQHDLDRRRPGTSRYTTQRREPDQVKILSGVFEGVTTGTSIGLLIENTDQRSQDYGAIKDVFRPDTPTIPMSRNMACVTTVAADAHPHVKRRCALRPERLPKNIWRKSSALKFAAV